MLYDQEKVDEMALALLYLTTSADQFGAKAWKGLDWDTLGRLHQKGYISDPKGRELSVYLTETGRRLSKELFQKHFSVNSENDLQKK